MPSSLFLGAYWEPRKETAQTCAQKLGNTLLALGDLSPAFSHWFRKGATRDQSLRAEVNLAGEELSSLIMSGTNRKDLDRSSIAAAGYRVSLWTGQSDEQAASLTVKCCSTVKLPVPSNSLVLNLPVNGTRESPDLLSKNKLTQIVEIVVQQFDPEWAVITSVDHLNRVRRSGEFGPFVGWISYFKNLSNLSRNILPSSIVERQHQLGGILRLTPEQFDVANAAHVQEAEDIFKAIRELL